MKFLVTGAIALLALCLTSSSTFSQKRDNIPTKEGFPVDVYPKDPNETLLRTGDRGSVGGRSVSREPRVLSNGALAPSPADRNAFRYFLRDGNTGLLRLMPREIYDSETYHTKSVIKIRGGGAYYSFADLTHAYGYGSDIQLEYDTLSVGFAGADYGILTNLGDVPLTDVTLEDPRTSVLANYKAFTTESKARAEYVRFREGVTIEGALYKSRLPLVVNATYLLRSIIFGGSDVLVAFRVVRKDTDGSAIILWKRLKQYSISAP